MDGRCVHAVLVTMQPVNTSEKPGKSGFDLREGAKIIINSLNRATASVSVRPPCPAKSRSPYAINRWKAKAVSRHPDDRLIFIGCKHMKKYSFYRSPVPLPLQARRDR